MQMVTALLQLTERRSRPTGLNSTVGANTDFKQLSITARGAYSKLHPSGVVHWVPEQLNIKAVTGACKLIDGCSLAQCSATVSVVSAGICHRNKVNSIA